MARMVGLPSNWGPKTRKAARYNDPAVTTAHRLTPVTEQSACDQGPQPDSTTFEDHREAALWLG
jgi:hypothetical protein